MGSSFTRLPFPVLNTIPVTGSMVAWHSWQYAIILGSGSWGLNTFGVWIWGDIEEWHRGQDDALIFDMRASARGVSSSSIPAIIL